MPSGGGNRGVARDIVRGAREAAKQLGGKAAKVGRHCYADSETKVVSEVKDDRTIRRKDDKFETEKVVLVDSSSEHGSIVGWGCYPNNEKLIQLYPSPEFLNSLPFIKKFYPAPRWGEGKFPKDSHEIVAISRHSERQRRNPANINTNKSKGEINMNNSTETKNLAAWLPSRLAAKKLAFTLAEILITLGIIGVVAAFTIPTLMFQYQKKSLETQFKAAYSLINQAILMVKQETGSNSLYNDYVVYSPEKDYYKRDEFIKEFYKHVHATNEVVPNNIQYSIYSDGHVKRYADNTSFSFERPDTVLANGMTMYATINGGLDGKHIIFCVDVNGIKPPNRMGHDLFLFIVDSSDKLVGRKQMKIYTDEELGDLSSGGINNALGLPCSKHSKQSANGIGCTWYAINDVCPDDNTKGYWECLPR